MKKRNSILARILAALALIGAVVAVVIVVSAGVKEESTGTTRTGANKPAKQQQAKSKPRPKTYEVQSGDTLSSIAHKYGLTVSELQSLNPEVDAQILTVGEVLKLRE